MIKGVFFDLDGTLLPMSENEFIKVYFKELSKKLVPLGYESQKLIDVIWQGTMKMIRNKGDKTNEKVFWEYFEECYGKDKLKDKDIIDSFYTNEFKETKKICEDNPLAKEIVKFCKENGLITVLSTNPIFPKPGTMTRMSYIGLEEDDFDYVTTYENSYFCKPNPNYFISLLDKFNLKPEEVIVFGNSREEDYECARKCGLKCYLVGNYLIDPQNREPVNHINMEDVIQTINNHLLS